MPLTIRTERDGDIADVDTLQMAAFGGHGSAVVEIVRAIRSKAAIAHPVLSLVGVDGKRVVGHVMFSPGLLDAVQQLVRVQVLSPLAVLPNHQGRGVARALVEHGLTKLNEVQTPLVFLEGDPRVYSKLGFEAAVPLGFRRPSLRIPKAAFQVQRLSTAEAWMTGTLVYDEVFWTHDAVGLR